MKGVPQRRTIDKLIEDKLSETESQLIYQNGKLQDHKHGHMHDLHQKEKKDLEAKQDQLLKLLNEVRTKGGKNCVEIYEEYKKIIE